MLFLTYFHLVIIFMFFLTYLYLMSFPLVKDKSVVLPPSSVPVDDGEAI